MQEKLISHLRTLVTVDAGLATALPDYIQHITVRKREVLLQEGLACNYNYFVAKGCLRMFHTDNKGVEHTTQFAIENWWITDYMAFQTGQPSNFCIQAVEHSDIIAINLASQQKLFNAYPSIESYFRQIYQKAYAASQLKVKYFSDFSKEELYFHFSKNYPQFINRIPQYLIASFLDFTPEYLSEIRKRNVS